MKKIIIAILSLAMEANSFIGFGQQENTQQKDSINTQMQKIVKPESKPNWIKFKDDNDIDPRTIFSRYKSEFNLKDDDNMILYKTRKDDLGFTHYLYQQYYKNICIDEGTYIVHSNKNGITYAANGKLHTGIDISVIPVLNDQQAIDAALKYVKAKEYMWQSDFWEKDLQARTLKTDTSYYPVPKLVIRKNRKDQINGSPDTTEKQYCLAYRLDIYSSDPFYAQRIYVDAKTGEIIEVLPLQSN
jgi:bacillolysin